MATIKTRVGARSESRPNFALKAWVVSEAELWVPSGSGPNRLEQIGNPTTTSLREAAPSTPSAIQ